MSHNVFLLLKLISQNFDQEILNFRLQMKIQKIEDFLVFKTKFTSFVLDIKVFVLYVKYLLQLIVGSATPKKLLGLIYFEMTKKLCVTS